MSSGTETNAEAALRWWFDQRELDAIWWEHAATATVEEAKEVKEGLPEGNSKSLLLADNNDTLVLVCLPGQARADTKGLAKALGTSRLSFADPDAMEEILGVTPGNLSPLALINDRGRQIDHVVLDAGLMAEARIWVHPLRNTASVGVTPDGLSAFVADHGTPAEILPAGTTE